MEKTAILLAGLALGAGGVVGVEALGAPEFDVDVQEMASVGFSNQIQSEVLRQYPGLTKGNLACSWATLDFSNQPVCQVWGTVTDNKCDVGKRCLRKKDKE